MKKKWIQKIYYKIAESNTKAEKPKKIGTKLIKQKKNYITLFFNLRLSIFSVVLNLLFNYSWPTCNVLKKNKTFLDEVLEGKSLVTDYTTLAYGNVNKFNKHSEIKSWHMKTSKDLAKFGKQLNQKLRAY